MARDTVTLDGALHHLPALRHQMLLLLGEQVYPDIGDTEAHFRFEEEVLFPALESTTPMAAGPTSVMRSEHAQMRELFGELSDACDRCDDSRLADVAEMLLLLMQQHNMKEENVLYPIADQSLGTDLLEQHEIEDRG